MELEFKRIEACDLGYISGFFCRRPNKTCDSVCLDSFIWRDFAGVRFAVAEGRALLWLMESDGVIHSAMPTCSEEDLPRYFDMSVEYFNNVLRVPFSIMLADEAAVDSLSLRESGDFYVEEQVDLKDYLYDGDALRTLSGKKLHKKKNHLNAFLKEYDGRFVYRSLCCDDRRHVSDLLDRWRREKGDSTEMHLDYELNGIRDLLDNCSQLRNIGIRMAGVFVDGILEAFTVGSYNPLEKMAVIHIEKANAEIKGLYQFINQQFLVHEFPDAVIVNREDDLGQEGLRQAKESYHPIGFARKYLVKQIVTGSE